jgi:hypothetical protein
MAGHVSSGRTGTFEEKKASIKSGDYHRAKGVRAEFLNEERIIMEEIIKICETRTGCGGGGPLPAGAVDQAKPDD